MSVMIETENLGRYFGEIKAVDGVSFQVKVREVLGFLGPNGAGKSTTMKMLTCFLLPSFGSAKVGGYDVVRQSREVRKILGYLPENAPLYGEMEVLHFLQFIAEVRGLKGRMQAQAIERVIHLTGLNGVLGQRIETLSKGYKRRVGLAQAIVHDPTILILDEPTDGLDPNQKHDVRTLILGMAKEKCILLSTHILEEVDAVCTRAVIVTSGKIVADASPDELRQHSKIHGAITLRAPRQNAAGLRLQLQQVPGVREVLEEDRGGEEVRFTLISEKGSDVLSRLLRVADQQRWSIGSLRVERGELDEVFRDITRPGA